MSKSNAKPFRDSRRAEDSEELIDDAMMIQEMKPPQQQQPPEQKQHKRQMQQAATGTFVWMSDIHLDLLYGTDQANVHVAGAACDLPSSKTRYPFGHVGCDSPYTLLEEVVRKAQQTLENPDFVALTGDFCRHDTENFDDPSAMLKATLSNVTQSLQQMYTYTSDNRNDPPQTNMMLPSIGNNDVTPDYYLDVNNPGGPLQLIAEAWDPWLDDPTEKATLMRGGYWARDISDTVTVISLNTVVYSVYHDPAQQDIGDPLEQFTWLTDQLENIASKNRYRPKGDPPQRVIIMGHIPPTISSYHHEQNWHDVYADRYWQTIEYYQDLISAQMFGHIHADEFRVIDSPAFKEPMPLFMASSMTAIYGSNPSFRLVTYDTQTGEILDYDTYYIDLEDPDMDDAQKGSVQWKQLEPFTQAFSVQDLSGSSLQSIAKDVSRFETVAQTLLQRRHVQTRMQDTSEPCDETCRLQWACTIQSISRSDYDVCVQTRGDGKFGTSNQGQVLPAWLKTLLLAAGVGMACVIFLMWSCGIVQRMRTRRQYQTAQDAEGDGVFADEKSGKHDLPLTDSNYPGATDDETTSTLHTNEGDMPPYAHEIA